MATLGARPPGSNEARVPCPLCGGLIHPIAGKCKHCKADLSSYRAQRPQAAAQLPALATPAAAPAPVAVPASGPVPTPVMPTNGHSQPAASPWAPPAQQAAYAPPTANAPAPPPLAQMHEQQTQAVLPQRPAGMSWTHMQKQAPSPSPWRSWPMLVIILAMIAIVTAVVIMVWPSSSRADGKNGLEPPPAPERMNTKPSANDDPWGASSSQTEPPTKDAVLAQISKHICARALACTNHTLRDLCGSDAIHGSIPQTCTAATDRCLAHVDTLACSAPLDDVDALEGLLAQVPECVEAIHC